MVRQRHQRSRAAGSKLPEGVLYVGRPSIWGNPWIGPDAVYAYKMFCEQITSGVLCITNIEGTLNVELTFRKPIDEWNRLRELIFEYRRDPQDVACWCSLDAACHGNVIMALPYLLAWNAAARIPLTV